MRIAPRVFAVLGCSVLFAIPASAVTMDWAFVGNPNNPQDSNFNCGTGASCGDVAYEYAISKYEVTNAQYVEFLNAKAASDPLGLYNAFMTTQPQGGITRSGVSGSFTYSVKPGFAAKPVTYVTFYNAARFTNWLNNGQGTADTESGAYTLLGGTPIPSNGLTFGRNPGAIVFLPSDNEWYKAAYYDGITSTYFDYPAGSDIQTICASPTATPNRANCNGVVGTLTDVGSYPGSASPYGTFDQGGNVWEWTQHISGPRRALRGGAWNGSPSDFAATEWYVEGFATSLSANFGFRVAAIVPAPSAGPVVAAAFAALIVRARLTRAGV